MISLRSGDRSRFSLGFVDIFNVILNGPGAIVAVFLGRLSELFAMAEDQEDREDTTYHLQDGRMCERAIDGLSEGLNRHEVLEARANTSLLATTLCASYWKATR